MCHLAPEESEDPHLVIKELFSYAHLAELRELLREWLRIATAGNWHKYSSKERSGLLYFYEKLEKLIEAAYLIHEQVIAGNTKQE